MNKKDKSVLDKIHESTAPKINSYQEYKTAFSLAMITIIHLEETYPNFKEQMSIERMEHSKKQ